MAGTKKIGLIGAGIMGRGIANNLKKTGAKLKLFARNPDKIRDMEDENTQVVDCPKDAVTDSDYTIFCLTEDKNIRSIFYSGGVLESLQGILLDVGTTSPELTMEMNLACLKKGARFIDSPMTGSRTAARDGQILFMMGGSDADFEDCRFIFEACGKNVVRCGETGSGQLAKITINMIQAGILQIYMEGFMLAVKSGVKRETLNEILSQSAAKSGISDFKFPFLFSHNFETHFSLKNMNKDLNHALRLAMKNHASLPLSSSLKAVYDSGMNSGFGEEDFCSLLKVNEKLNATEL
ncbi:MAG: NAD(P)-dependent oxidoreductase [Leptospira sp.]|nr:NAD(P)-dependent oxidoreductase [Leptospira sp.]